MTDRTSVAIVFSDDYASLVTRLGTHRLWLMHSESNSELAKALWKEIGADPTRAMDVTLENPSSGLQSLADLFAATLDNVLVHFGEVEAIEVVGADATQLTVIDERMTEAGLVRDMALPYKHRYRF